jgi:hypothetical protein
VELVVLPFAKRTLVTNADLGTGTTYKSFVPVAMYVPDPSALITNAMVFLSVYRFLIKPKMKASSASVSSSL